MTRLFLFLFCSLFIVTSCNKKEKIKPENDCSSGTAGELTWTTCADGTLSISGTGSMPDYNCLMHVDPANDIIYVEGCPPWKRAPFFNYDVVTSIIINDSVTSIGNQAFSSLSGLTSVIIPNSVTSIGEEAFANCIGSMSVIIPNSVINIRSNTFVNCSALTSVTIPNSVTSIENGAFARCSSLTEVINERTIPQMIDILVFYNINLSSLTLRVPAVSLDAYRVAPVWKNFGNIVAI